MASASAVAKAALQLQTPAFITAEPETITPNKLDELFPTMIGPPRHPHRRGLLLSADHAVRCPPFDPDLRLRCPGSRRAPPYSGRANQRCSGVQRAIASSLNPSLAKTASLGLAFVDFFGNTRSATAAFVEPARKGPRSALERAGAGRRSSAQPADLSSSLDHTCGLEGGSAIGRSKPISPQHFLAASPRADRPGDYQICRTNGRRHVGNHPRQAHGALPRHPQRL